MPPASKKPLPAAAVPSKVAATPSPASKLAQHLATTLASDELAADAQVCLAQGKAGLSIPLPGVISTRNPEIDAVIGRGGIPLGRLTVLTGGEACGKTTLALHTVAEVQQMGGVALYIDAEYKLDMKYAAALGVDLDRLVLTQPRHIESCLALMNKSIEIVAASEPDSPILIVLDSMNASRSRTEFEGDFLDLHYAPQATALSKLLPKLIPKIGRRKVSLLFISQPREDIGGGANGQSKKNAVACGNAPKFYAALILQLINIGFLKEGEAGKPYGSNVLVKAIKNQVSMPFGEAKVQMIWGKGFNYMQSLLNRAVALRLLNSSAGGWYEMPSVSGVVGTHKWQGLRAFSKLIAKEPGVFNYLDAAVETARKGML